MASDGTIKITTELDNNAAQKSMSKFESIAKAGLKGVVTAATAASAAIGGIAAYSIKVGSSFEEGMSKVSAISGAAGSDLEALSDKAKEMGAKTKFSATEAASAFEYMAMAGWKTEDMLSGIDGIMNLAAASGEDLALTSDIVTDALTAFGLTAADSGRFADVLAATSSNANTNVSMMGETFKYVAPVAGALGYSAEDTAVAIGLMANSGIKAGQAGTALRAMLSRLAKPTEEVAAVMDKLDLSLTDSDGSMKSLNEIMLDLREGFSGLSESERASTAAALAGQEAMSGMLAIVTASDADFNKLKDSIYNCDGATEKMAATMQDNLKGSITILGSAVEGFGIQVYEKMQEPLRDVVETGIECVDGLSDAFESGGVKGVVEELGSQFDELTNRIAETSDVAAGIVGPFKNTAKIGVNLTKVAIIPMANGAKLLAENMDIVAPAVMAGVAAFKIYKPIMKTTLALTKAHAAAGAAVAAMEKANALQLVSTNGGLTVQQTLIALHNGQITATTALTGLWAKAQTKLNMAMAANPIGVVVTVAAALVAGVSAYVLVTDKAAENTRIFSEEEKKLCNSIDATSESLRKSKKVREENINGIIQEYGYTESLADELHKIVDENGQVKDGYADRAAFITSTLSEALGLEIELIDGQIQGYGELTDTIGRVIQKKKAEAVLTAYEEDYQAAIKNRASAMQDLIRVSNEYEEAQRKLKEAEIEQEKYLEENGILNQALTNTIDTLGMKMETLEEKVGKAKSSYEEYNNTISTYEGLSAAIEGDASQIEQALMTIQTNFKYYGEASNEELKQQAIKAGETMDLMGKAIKGGIVSATDGAVAETANMSALTLAELAKIPGGAAEVASEIDPAMLEQLVGLSGVLSAEAKSAVSGFLEGLHGVDEGTKEKFVKACAGALEGLKGFEEILPLAKTDADAFLEALATALEVHSPSAAVARIFGQVWPGASQGLDSGQGELTEKGNSVIANFLSSLSDGGLLGSARQVGTKIMSFFGLGISSQTENSKFAGKANAEAANFGAGSVNPSNTGMMFGSWYVSGVGSKIGKAKSEGESLADSAESGLNTADGYSIGSSFGSGFVSGIGSWISNAASKAAELANNALNAAKRALDSHSPSKKAKKIGKTLPQGFGVGVDEDADVAVKSAEEMSAATLDAIDTDVISKKLQGINIPDTMSRIYAAVDDRQNQVSQRVIAAVSGKENLAWREKKSEQIAHIPEEDINKLAKEFAIIASEEIAERMDGMGLYARERELFRMMREMR